MGNAGYSTGAVNKFRDRVFAAMLSMKKEVVKWPNKRERKKISARFKQNHGIPGAVEIVDGTPVVLSQRPHVDGGSYFLTFYPLLHV